MSEKEKEHTQEIEDELSKIKQEMSDIKEMLKAQKTENEEEDYDELFIDGDPDRPKRQKRPKRPKRPRRSHTFKIDFDDDFYESDIDNEQMNGVSDTLGEYFQSVFAGVSDNLRNSMNQMSRGFRSIDLSAAKEAQREAERQINRVKRTIKNQEKSIKKEMHRAKKDISRAQRQGYRHGRVIKFKTLKGKELESFYEQGPEIVGALSDARRLKILKALEKHPLYQGDLSELTEVKGGTFKHHMDALIKSKFVHQEKTRGRYLITQLGMEALKLAEMLYRRHTYEVKKESGEDIEVDIDSTFDDEEAVDVDVSFNDTQTDLDDIQADLEDQLADAEDSLVDIDEQITDAEDAINDEEN
ncbi:MAG: ArsR/SmtB family transcription factor [Candidatus Kariarchaeaceae archaeon]|jgi:DNA-binding transcriptional ArsR family regulator